MSGGRATGRGPGNIKKIKNIIKHIKIKNIHFNENIRPNVYGEFDEKGNKKRETEHKAGKEDGIYLIYYENGQKEATGPYTSEARIGKWTFWHDNGNKWQEGSYIKGARDGKWSVWKVNGKLKEELIYDNGDFVERIKY